MRATGARFLDGLSNLPRHSTVVGRAVAAVERQNRANAILGMSFGLLIGALLAAFTLPEHAMAFGPVIVGIAGNILGRYSTRLAAMYVDIRGAMVRR